MRYREEMSEPSMDWWRDAKFGMFIHWGLYSIPAGWWNGKKVPGIGEWIMQKEQIPVDEYEKLAERFNPTEFDAQRWVNLAKDAGMKWIVITAKHHDGFCMYDSEVTDYNIVDATPFGKDPILELAEACEKEDIRLGFYYSQTLDWHHPDGMGNDWDYISEGKNFDDYLQDYVKPQVEELLTNYGDIGVIWFDIGTPTPEQARDLKEHVRDFQSDTIVSGRISPQHWESEIGDYEERGDNEIPDEKIDSDWETPATINDTWGYKTYDNNWKSPGVLLEKLVEIVSKGGNYLLNVGPTKSGKIPQPSKDRLLSLGNWLKSNGESIYGKSPTQIGKPEWGYCTSGSNKLYLHVFAWPSKGKLVVENVDRDITRSYLLQNPDKDLEFDQEGERVVIEVPERAPNSLDTVVVLQK